MKHTELIGKTVMKDIIIEEHIGSGGFGDVYKAYSLLGEDRLYCAVKHIVIPQEKDYNDQLRSMKNDRYATDEYFRLLYKDVLNEINLMYLLSGKSRNIVAYQHYDIDGPKGDPKHYEIFIKMEHLTSLDIYSVKRDMSVEEILRMGIDIASALAVCHSESILHRDIKTANIFVNDKGLFKLGDFGLAKKLIESSYAKSKVGTDAYKAPEVFNPFGKYDKTIDIYSLGIVLYEMFNHGRLPFMPEYPQTYGPTDIEDAIGRRVRGEKLPPAAQATSEINEVINKGCAPNPQDRYQTAEELKLALQLVLQGMDNAEQSRTVSRVKGTSTYSYIFNDSLGKPLDAEEDYTHVDMFASSIGKRPEVDTSEKEKDRLLWELAKKDGTEKALREYLKESPAKAFEQEAWELLDNLLWSTTCALGTRKGFEDYQTSDGKVKKYVDQARKAIRKLETIPVEVAIDTNPKTSSAQRVNDKARKRLFLIATIAVVILTPVLIYGIAYLNK